MKVGEGSERKRNVLEGNPQERKWEKGCFYISVFTSERNSSLKFVAFGEFYFQFVVKLWYFDVNRNGLVRLKVTECLFSDCWGWTRERKRKKKGEKPSPRRAVA